MLQNIILTYHNIFILIAQFVNIYVCFIHIILIYTFNKFYVQYFPIRMDCFKEEQKSQILLLHCNMFNDK